MITVQVIWTIGASVPSCFHLALCMLLVYNPWPFTEVILSEGKAIAPAQHSFFTWPLGCWCRIYVWILTWGSSHSQSYQGIPHMSYTDLYFTYLINPRCGKRLGAGGEGGIRGWDGWMASWIQWTWVWANSGMIVKDREAWCTAVHGVPKNQTQHMSYGSRHFPFKLKMQYLYKYIYTHIYKLRLEGKFWMWMQLINCIFNI